MTYRTSANLLRDVDVDGFRLRLWDTQTYDHLNKSLLGYEFCAKDGTVLFKGEDFGCSPLHAIDSDETLRSILGFLTLRPGDTDADYFADYTPEQLSFAEGEAESLSLWGMDDLEDGLPEFLDWAPRCKIQWVDPKTGKVTPDTNRAIGTVVREAWTEQYAGAVGGVINYERSEDYPICAEHAKRLPIPHWVFKPYTTEE